VAAGVAAARIGCGPCRLPALSTGAPCSQPPAPLRSTAPFPLRLPPPPPRRCAGAAVARAQLKLWDQCGGQGGNCKEAGAGACVDGPIPGQSCPSGSSCLKQSNWYYQCLPTEGYTCIPTNGNSPGAPQGSTGGAQYTLGWWDQCGGMGGNCNSYGQCADSVFASYACPSGGWGLLDRAALGKLEGRASQGGRRPLSVHAELAPEPSLPPPDHPSAGTSCQRQNQWVSGWGAAGGGCWMG
jgi:hypothetical protein